jgi:hypothetical protein
LAVFGGLILCCSALAAWQDAAQGVSLETQTPIPVSARFIRFSMTGTLSSSTVNRSDAPSYSPDLPFNTVAGERLFDSNELSTPVRGVVLVEVPLTSLKFGNEGSGYLARAKVTVEVVNGNGNVVWTAQKDVAVKGAQKKLEAQRQGSLFFEREVTLPKGAGYVIRAKVEDLQEAHVGTVEVPVKPGTGAQSLHASDAMFVRKYDSKADKFEADQVISFEGNALSPVLDPVFPAGREFGLQLFFVVYPDIQGPEPAMSLELVSGGRVTAQGALSFKQKMRDMAFETKSANISGGHAHEFPYLANMKFTQLPAGDYEAVITIHQGGNMIKRTVPFKVAGDAPPAKL